MYLRHATVRRGGKTHTYWRLVRSVRIGRKVRQETVAPRGELDAQGQLADRSLADRLVGVERQPGLFDDDLRGVKLERDRCCGDVWLAWRLWQALGLDRLLAELLPPGRDDVSWATMAAVLDSASHRANCTSPRIGSGVPLSTICLACPKPRSTHVGTLCCPTRLTSERVCQSDSVPRSCCFETR